jgi:hypothetical protein
VEEREDRKRGLREGKERRVDGLKGWRRRGRKRVEREARGKEREGSEVDGMRGRDEGTEGDKEEWWREEAEV